MGNRPAKPNVAERALPALAALPTGLGLTVTSIEARSAQGRRTNTFARRILSSAIGKTGVARGIGHPKPDRARLRACQRGRTQRQGQHNAEHKFHDVPPLQTCDLR